MKDRQEHGTQGTVLVLGGDADVIKINNCNRNLFRRNSVDWMTEVKDVKVFHQQSRSR